MGQGKLFLLLDCYKKITVNTLSSKREWRDQGSDRRAGYWATPE
jgi:hypothetical protein